jgi:hypothetical protein
MKSYLILIFSLLFSVLYAQDYDDSGGIMEVIGENNASRAELFGDKSHPYTIEQYKLNESKGTLDLFAGCKISFLNNDVVKLSVFNKKRRIKEVSYWRWFSDTLGNKFFYVQETNKKGVPDGSLYPYDKITSKIVLQDSTVDISKPYSTKTTDTLCSSLEKYIYRGGKLIECWHSYTFGKGCNWANQKEFSIEQYSYPDSNTTITERFLGNMTIKKSKGREKEVRTYDNSGKITSILLIDLNSNYTYERRFFLKDGLWNKTEKWENGILVEIIQKNILY